MDVKFEGMGELLEQVNRMENGADEARDGALKKGADILQKATKAIAPVRTGNLRDHIEVSDIKNGEIEVYVDQQGIAYYGYFLEVGTSTMDAQPFMYPTFMTYKNNIEKAMAAELRVRLGLV